MEGVQLAARPLVGWPMTTMGSGSVVGASGRETRAVLTAELTAVAAGLPGGHETPAVDVREALAYVNGHRYEHDELEAGKKPNATYAIIARLRRKLGTIRTHL